MNNIYQIAPLQEVDLYEYVKKKEKAVARKNALYLLAYLLTTGTALVGIVMIAEERRRSLAICFYGVSFMLGLLAFVYIGIEKMRAVRRSDTKHVYQGEALVDSKNPRQIQYIDWMGKSRIVECSLLENLGLGTSVTIGVTLEDERVVEVKHH